VDKFWQVLYDNAKCLIHIEGRCSAHFLSTPHKAGLRLSLPALDNPVHKFEQALYDSAKWLIFKDNRCDAQKIGIIFRQSNPAHQRAPGAQKPGVIQPAAGQSCG
jgi:hypothetical protein